MDRGRVSPSTRDLCPDQHAPDAVSLAAIELLHRPVRNCVSLHHLLAAARQSAGHGDESRRNLERTWYDRSAGTDLGGTMSAMLDRMRSVSKHPRQPGPIRLASTGQQARTLNPSRE